MRLLDAAMTSAAMARRAVRRWQSFHADTGTQIAIAHALVSVPALYLAIDFVVHWTRLPMPMAPARSPAVRSDPVALSPWHRTGRAPGHRDHLLHFGGGMDRRDALRYVAGWHELSPAEALLALENGWNPFFAASGIAQADVSANGVWTSGQRSTRLPAASRGQRRSTCCLSSPRSSPWCRRGLCCAGARSQCSNLASPYAAAGNPVALGQVFTFYVDEVRVRVRHGAAGCGVAGGLSRSGAAPRWVCCAHRSCWSPGQR